MRNPVPPELTKEGILIVDDDENVVFAYEKYLRKKGFKNIFTATSIEACFDVLRQSSNAISVLILDWVLNQYRDCREILAFLNQQSRHFNVIFMSTKIHVPKDYYDEYAKKSNFHASEFFTVKDCHIIYDEIIKVMQKEYSRNLEKSVVA